MKIKYSEPETIELEKQIEVDEFVHESYIDVIDATIKIRCNKERWERDGKDFTSIMEIEIEDKYPDANFSLTRDLDHVCGKTTVKFEGDYAIVTIPFINGDEY